MYLIYVSGRLVTSRRRDGALAQCAIIARKSLSAAPSELLHSSSASTTITARFDGILHSGSVTRPSNCIANDFFIMSWSGRNAVIATVLASAYDPASWDARVGINRCGSANLSPCQESNKPAPNNSG